LNAGYPHKYGIFAFFDIINYCEHENITGSGDVTGNKTTMQSGGDPLLHD
jgi:hypothetical protein